MLAFGLFLKSNWRGVLLAVVGGLFVYFMGNYQARGSLIANLQTSVTRLDSLIYRKDDTLAVERARITRLRADTARLNRTVNDYERALLRQDAQLQAGQVAALQTDQAIEAGKQTANKLVNAMSASEKRHAAELGLAYEKLSYTGPGLTDADTATNARFAKLTAYGKVYRDSTQALKRVVGQQGQEIKQLNADKTTLTARTSDLENVLNGIRSDVNDDFIESQKEKHPLGWKQKESKERLRQKVVGRLPKTTY